MAAAKGSGYVETVKSLNGTVRGFRARRTVDGRSELGELRATKLAAERDRLRLMNRKVPKARVSEMPTVREYAERMMNGEYGSRLAKTTFGTNDIIRITHLNASPLGKMRVDRVRRPDCQAFVDAIKKHVVVREKHKVRTFDGEQPRARTETVERTELHPASPSYVRRVWAFVSKVLSEAYGDESLALGGSYGSPGRGVRLPTVEERENRVLTPDEAAGLLEPQSRLEAMLLVALHTGMRRSEVCRLRWSHVSEEWIRVPGTKSKNSRAAVPTTPEAWAAIQKQPRIAASGKPNLYVFATEDGGMVDPHNLTRDFGRWKKKAGFPARTRLQDLRGTYVSLLVQSGVDIKTVQVLARHGDPRTTMSMYARSDEENQRRAVNVNLRSKMVPKSLAPDESATSA